jgi:hypothetical protein
MDRKLNEKVIQDEGAYKKARALEVRNHSEALGDKQMPGPPPEHDGVAKDCGEL